MKPVRWGIISTGRIAHTFAKDLRHIEEGTVVAVGSRNLDSAKVFANEFGLERAYGSYEELVEDPEVDAVYVGTPHPMHLDNALLALNHGKPVLVEKAFTMNANEARELIDVARAKKLFVMEAMWTRFLPHVGAIHDLTVAGALGELVTFEADHGKWFPTDASSRLFAPELGGSALLDLGIYPVSFAFMLLGRPSRVLSLVEPSFTGVDGQVSMLFGYDSGAHAVLTCTSSARSPTRACITGRDARIEIGGDFYAPASYRFISRDGQSRTYRFDVPGRGLQFQAIEVARCLDAGLLESPIMPLDETLAIMETLDLVLSNSGSAF